eukprot:7005489-Pyramimonas_sp.AAC.1
MSSTLNQAPRADHGSTEAHHDLHALVSLASQRLPKSRRLPGRFEGHPGGRPVGGTLQHQVRAKGDPSSPRGACPTRTASSGSATTLKARLTR